MEQFCPFVRDNFLGVMSANEAGYGVYNVNVTAGTEENELIISNLWDSDPNSTTSIFLVEEDYLVEYPAYADNYLTTDSNGPIYASDLVQDGSVSTWSSCATQIDLNIQFLVNIGGSLYYYGGTTNIVLTKP